MRNLCLTYRYSNINPNARRNKLALEDLGLNKLSPDQIIIKTLQFPPPFVPSYNNLFWFDSLNFNYYEKNVP
jgi:hypothetical protein